MNLDNLWEMVRDREALHAAVHGVTKSWRRLSNRTELNWKCYDEKIKQRKAIERVCWSTLRPASGSMIHQKDSQGSENCYTYSYGLL